MSGFASKDDIERVRNGLDIADVIGSYIQLKRVGSSTKALCPFHKEKTPSFHVNSARQAFHCFGCGAGGDVFKFVMLYENVDFPTALRLLASRAGVTLEFEKSARPRAKGEPAKDDLFKANEEASARYARELAQSPEAAGAREYLERRRLDLDAWKEWGIGYAPDGWGFLSDAAGARTGMKMKALEAAGLLSSNEKGNVYDRFRDRIMFTIRDELGRVAGFSGRLLKESERGGAKYVNTPETELFRKSRLLYGLDKARKPIAERREAILCEGQIDCIRCHLAGFTHAVASQGTAFTEDHARLLKRYADKVVLVLDSDAAGYKAALRSAELLIREGLTVALATLPAGEDPDSLILRGGAEAFARVLEQAKTAVGFMMDGLRAEGELESPEGVLRSTRAVIELASNAPSAVQAEQLLREAATELGVGFVALQNDLRRTLRMKYRLGGAGARGAEAGDGGAERAGPAAHPVDEVELAALLCAHPDPELTAFVRQWLPYDLLSDADCQTIVAILAEEEEELMSALDDAGERCQTLAARVATAPSKVTGAEQDENLVKAAQDLVLRIWRKHLENRRAAISEKMNTAGGEERKSLLHEMTQLLLDIGKLKRGWEAAKPILTAHLNDRAGR